MLNIVRINMGSTKEASTYSSPLLVNLTIKSFEGAIYKGCNFFFENQTYSYR